jgi:hypothetical protein
MATDLIASAAVFCRIAAGFVVVVVAGMLLTEMLTIVKPKAIVQLDLRFEPKCPNARRAA